MKKLIFLLSCLFLCSIFVSAQQPDINTLLQNAPPELQEILKNLPPGSLNQVATENQPKGKLNFEVIPSGSALGVKALGAPIDLAPLKEAMKGGTVFAFESGYCGKDLVTKYMYVLKLDTSNKRNLFSTNQLDQSAKLNLNGVMKRWEMNCNTKEFQRAGEGFGGMEVYFSTSVHIRPRFFQVLAGSKDMRGKYLKEAKEAQQFMLKNTANYYRDIGAYLKKPKIGIINIPDYGPVGGGTVPAPTGMTSDAKDAVTTGSAIGTALNAIKAMTGIKTIEDTKKAVIGFALGHAEKQLSKGVESLGIAEATARYNHSKELIEAVADPAGYVFDKAVQGMIQQMAAVNKQYAERGEPQSQKIDQAAQKEMKHKDKAYSYVNADYMLSILDRAYDSELKRLEAEAEMEKHLPPTSASGRIWGPGLWQGLQVFAMTAGEPVAFSDAAGENKSSYDPNVLAALRKAGYPVPEQIPEAKYKDENFEFDASKPYFHGKLSGTKMIALPNGMEYPELIVLFSISSPEEPYQFEWKGKTIFDPPFIDNDDDDDKEKCSFYVSAAGNNANPGSIQQPFATLQHALNKAKTCRDEKKSVDIILQNGTYRQSATAIWNDAANAPPLNIMAAISGAAVFTAGPNANTGSGSQPFAIKMSGAKNVSIRNLRFTNFPKTAGNASPGIILQGGSQVAVVGCLFN